MNTFYEISTFTETGHVRDRRLPEQSRSFVKAFLQLLYCETSALSQAVIDITNTSRTVANTTEAAIHVIHPGLDAAEDSHGVSSAEGNVYADDCGIVVGTSSTAVAVADDNLVAQVTHGTGAGQLVHYGSWGLNYTTGASTSSIDFERIFRNASGGTITVAEIGIYATFGTGSSGTITRSEIFGACINRDVISPTVSVLNGEYLKVRYTTQVSV